MIVWLNPSDAYKLENYLASTSRRFEDIRISRTQTEVHTVEYELGPAGDGK